ncbi:MAG: DNA-binding domain-containing protein, partial [Gammaproteobacteria bacterium]|nr:DNA-binding domain-containing protein [Gammaproteobacteria bacterium]
RRDTGGPFLAWVREEIAQHRIYINQADARVHVVPEGVLLVSPALFRDYARAVGDEGGWEHAQKKFVKLKLHTPAPDGSNITYCRVELPGGANRGPATMIKCILVPDATLIFGDTPPPPPNPTLRVVAHPRILPTPELETPETTHGLLD